MAAAEANGIPRRTWSQWMAIADGRQTVYSDGSPVADSTKAFLAALADEIARAQAECETLRTKELLAGAETDWRAAESWLRRSSYSRERWREERTVKVAQQTQVNHWHRVLETMSQAEIIEACGPEIRALLE